MFLSFPYYCYHCLFVYWRSHENSLLLTTMCVHNCKRRITRMRMTWSTRRKISENTVSVTNFTKQLREKWVFGAQKPPKYRRLPNELCMCIGNLMQLRLSYVNVLIITTGWQKEYKVSVLDIHSGFIWLLYTKRQQRAHNTHLSKNDCTIAKIAKHIIPS